MKFLAIGDFHYKKHMYTSQVPDLEKMLLRGAEEKVDFAIHLGDFCNDYIGSSELWDAWLNNPYGIPVYGIYGNHDLEYSTMQIVNSKLSNRPVHWGSGERIGYWYTDIGNFRLIGLDVNYSLSPEGVWEHNYDDSFGPPRNNTEKYSLGPVQRAWLDEVIGDAARQGKKVLTFSHYALWDIQQPAHDSKQVRELFHTYPGTVLASINGHLHADHFAVLDNIVYWDVNAPFMGGWKASDTFHYTDDMTYAYQTYADGNKRGSVLQVPLNTLTQASNAWFYKDPLCAIVTVTEDGYFKVEGSQSEWLYGIAPDYEFDGMKTCIEDREVYLKTR